MTPTLYELTIKPYLDPTFGDKSFTFDGSIKIHFDCNHPTSQIIFHIKNLTLNNATISVSSPTDADLSIVLPWTNDYEREFFKANFNRNCQQGASYTLYIEYTGPISRTLVGFYSSSYIDKATNRTA